MSNSDHKWTAIAWGAVGVAVAIGMGFGGCNGGTNYYDRAIAKAQAQTAIVIAKERANNVESRLAALERHHRANPGKTLGRVETKVRPVEEGGSTEGRSTTPEE